MSSDDLSKLPTIERLRKLIKTAEDFKSVVSQFGPVLKVLGIDVEKLQEGLSGISEKSDDVENLAQLPKRFNTHFLSRGWIAYESLKTQIVIDAVEKADGNDVDGAEALLVSHYSYETVKFWLNQMNNIHTFKLRMRLARLALNDYKEQRYHACIPVILSLVDGLVNELNKGSGLFKENTDLVAWDSIAGHPESLTLLAKVLSKARGKTHSEEIFIPYRNGILHGNDLSYDNQVVAAKTWALLFAVGDWARKIEKGERMEPQPSEPLTLQEQIEQFIQLRITQLNFKKRQAEWKPRNIVIGKHISASGNVDDYIEGTPERTLVEYLHYWKNRNYGEMSKRAMASFKVAGGAARKIRDFYDYRTLIDFEIKDVKDIALSATNISVSMHILDKNKQVNKDFQYRLLYLDATGKSQDRDESGFKWYITNWETFGR
jgi:hypothetical protein